MSGNAYFTVCDCVREFQEPTPAATHPAMASLYSRQAKLVESLNSLITNYVDPDEAYIDPDTGERWHDVAGKNDDSSVPFDSEQSLAMMRKMCRQLAKKNEFAINGHENRINYIVGSGHGYSVVPKEGLEVAEEKLSAVQYVLDEFLRENHWTRRQQEIVRRKDRDGEVFLRVFRDATGIPKLRFVEPEQVSTPQDRVTVKAESFGVVTDPDDVETVLAYWIDGEQVPADQIQHRKLGVDSNVKRGVPLFYPVHANLGRAQRLLRNMAAVSEIQAAIAMIRKHATGARSTIQDFVSGNADQTITNTNATNPTRYFRQYAPGTIIDANMGMEYEFPSHSVNPGAFVVVLQAILRAIASRLVMPEFMLTSDASNANFASTMVAEGPAHKQFSRLQWEMVEEDMEILDMVLDAAVVSGRIDATLRQSIEIDVEPPRLTTQDRNLEVDADTKLVQARIMSRHTAQIRQDLDPDKEDLWIEQDREKNDPFFGLDVDPADLMKRMGGNEDDQDGPVDEKPDADNDAKGTEK